MKINTQFPVAVHILSAVALANIVENQKPTAERIATSVNTNPVVIRRTNQLLKKAGFIKVIRGKGGIELLPKPQDITLLDILRAVRSEKQEKIFGLHENTNPDCPVGSTINVVIQKPFNAAQSELEKKLNTYSLYDVIKEIAELQGVSL